MLLANFQRDGRAVYDDNQGNRPNYQSTLSPIKLLPRPYDDTNHTIWVSTIVAVTRVAGLGANKYTICVVGWWCRQVPLPIRPFGRL
jgi:hypothetical protein